MPVLAFRLQHAGVTPYLAGLLLALLAGCTSVSPEPPIRLDTHGGDAWSFNKLINGQAAPGVCEQVQLQSEQAAVSAWASADVSRFSANVPLQAGSNRIRAICLQGESEQAVSSWQQWQLRLEDGPKAWARTRVEADSSIHLDAGRSSRAPGIPAPVVAYQWVAAADNPAALFLATSGKPLAAQPYSDQQLQVLPPPVDGDYYVQLRVQDALGRTDASTAMFRVEDGQPREVDLALEHPRWVDRAVVYGVVPYFFGPNGFADITARLDEIAGLGATAIWLSPVTAAPAEDFGYAVADHFRLRSEFGSETEFKALVARAHALGLRVILDFVPNHVSDQHPYYQHAQRFGPRSPYYDWFERDAEGEVLSYFDWDNLKNLNYDNPEVQNYILAASSYWVQAFDIDGFRVDAGWGVRQRAPEFWRRWREELKRIKPDIFLLAEASARDPFYLRNGFDAAYDWTNNLGEWAWREVFHAGRPADLGALRAALDQQHYPSDSLVFRFLNNNDTGERFISRHGVALTRVAAALQFTLPGIPLIYTGDEIGAQFEPYDEGPPLRWQDAAGLTPYYRRLAELRHTTPALWTGRLEWVGNNHEQQVLSYVRGSDEDDSAVLVVLNFSQHPVQVTLAHADTSAESIPTGQMVNLLTGERLTLDTVDPSLRLPAYGVAVLQAVQ